MIDNVIPIGNVLVVFSVEAVANYKLFINRHQLDFTAKVFF